MYMGITKYTATEKAEVLSPEKHRTVEAELHRIGKTSARDLTDEERQKFTDSVDNKQ